LILPSCGSVFKNDPQSYGRFGPPGKIIESAGLKGAAVGGAVVSERHANFIVNRGGATARDVLELIERIRRQVARRTGFALECEVRFLQPTGCVKPI
jgi:UDP-N-acetylmuramate dehydrogenase